LICPAQLTWQNCEDEVFEQTQGWMDCQFPESAAGANACTMFFLYSAPALVSDSACTITANYITKQAHG
jgi:hypothetical protein